MSYRRSLALLTLPVLAAACGGSDEAVDADSAAIIGDARTDGEQPEVVALDIKDASGTYVCTGTLIGRRTVLTARHCVEGRIDASGGCTVTVLVDRLGKSTADPATERYPAARCDMLEASGSIPSRNDLATVRLARDVAGIAPAYLANDDSPSGRYTAYGYGSFGAGPTFGTHCEHRSDGHKRKLGYEGALGFRFGQATCPGDSGGPHFIEGTSILAGVTSTGYSVGVAYEANAAVAPHRAWILALLAAYGDAPAR